MATSIAAGGGQWIEPDSMNPYRQAVRPKTKPTKAFWGAVEEALRDVKRKK